MFFLRRIYNPPPRTTRRLAEVLQLQDPVPEDVYDLGLSSVRDPLSFRPMEVHVPVQPQGGLVAVYEPQERLEAHVGGVVAVAEPEGRGMGDEDLRRRASDEVAGHDPRGQRPCPAAHLAL